MNKFNPNQVRIAILLVISVCCCILFYELTPYITHLINVFFTSIQGIFKVLRPFLIAFIIAIIINPILGFFEKHVKKITKTEGYNKNDRLISLALTYSVILLFIYFLIISILPNLIKSINTFLYDLPTNIDSLQHQLEILYASDSVNSILQIFSNIQFTEKYNITDLSSLMQIIYSRLYHLPDLISKLLLNTISATVLLSQFILGLVVSFYMLSDKEHFAKMGRNACDAVFSKRVSDFIVTTAHDCNDVFGRFFTGKVIDSLIMGLLFYIACSFLQVRYTGLYTAIFTVTNMIPYFGPFIGGIPIVLLSCTNSPISGVWMALIILALQQFDGIVLGPRILSQFTSLRPISIIFAILVGGQLFGVLGMFLAVPVFSVIATIVMNFMDDILTKKNTSK